MSLQRAMVSSLCMLIAVVITGILFWFMQYLVLPGEERMITKDSSNQVSFVPLQRDLETIQNQPEAEVSDPEPKVRPPMPTQTKALSAERLSSQLKTDLPILTPSLAAIDPSPLNFSDLVVAQEDADLTPAHAPSAFNQQSDSIPLVRINPRYPPRAASRGIEGWVKLQFVIKEDGRVSNVRVIEAEPARVFDREAIRAVRKWRFRPRYVDGVAVPRPSEQVLHFQMTPAA